MKEQENLEEVEAEYAEQKFCSCAFIPECQGVPLNEHPEWVQESEEAFRQKMKAKKELILAQSKHADTGKKRKRPVAPSNESPKLSEHTIKKKNKESKS